MKPSRQEHVTLDDRDPWLTHLYGGKPIAPRVVGEEEDFARIGWQNFLVEPLVWGFAGFVLHGGAWRTPADILGYWMVLFVMLPLRLMDSDRPRDWRFRLQYLALQSLTLGGGFAGWWLAGGPPA